MITQEQMKAVVDKIAKNHNPEKIVLFGSYADGNPTTSGDLALLVVKDFIKDNISLQKETRTDFTKRDFALDLLVCNPFQIKDAALKTLSFLYQISNNSKVVYERK